MSKVSLTLRATAEVDDEVASGDVAYIQDLGTKGLPPWRQSHDQDRHEARKDTFASLGLTLRIVLNIGSKRALMSKSGTSVGTEAISATSAAPLREANLF